MEINLISHTYANALFKQYHFVLCFGAENHGMEKPKQYSTQDALNEWVDSSISVARVLVFKTSGELQREDSKTSRNRKNKNAIYISHFLTRSSKYSIPSRTRTSIPYPHRIHLMQSTSPNFVNQFIHYFICGISIFLLFAIISTTTITKTHVSSISFRCDSMEFSK